MRPRISQQETKFILECLEIKRTETQKLLERYEQLTAEVATLRKTLHMVGPYFAFKEGYKEKKQELDKLEAQRFNLYHRITVFDSLIAKYSNLASGEKHKGRYPNRATAHEILLPLVQT